MAKILLKCVLGLACCIATLVLASPVVLSSDYNSSEVHPASKLLALNLEPTSPLNEPVTSLSVIGTDDTDIDCDGASYGFDLGIFDCEEAKTYFPAGSDQVLWAERNTGWQKKVFQLPYRAMGDRASCYLQPVLIDGATSAKASLNQVRNAAAMIRDKCASGGKLQGGIATNIGGDNKLAVIMGGYKAPSVIQCRGLFRFPDSCLDVLDTMPATTKTEVFAFPENKSATVLLPQGVESGRLVNQIRLTGFVSLTGGQIDDTHCQLRIFAASADAWDTGSWYDIWEGMTALWSACSRHRRGGSMSKLGDNGNLFLTLTSQSADAKDPTWVDPKGPMALQKSSHLVKEPGVL